MVCIESNQKITEVSWRLLFFLLVYPKDTELEQNIVKLISLKHEHTNSPPCHKKE